MTWPTAYRIADEQVAYWRRSGITAQEAFDAIRCDYPTTWADVRQRLALWAMAHREQWEGSGSV